MPETKLSKSGTAIIDAGVDILCNSPAGDDMAYMHSIMCQVGLPRKKVEGQEFMRQSGQAWLNIQAGYLDEGTGAVLQPIPYGVMPRLGLGFITTYAVKYGKQEIPLGDSAAQFLESLGMDTSGRRYSTLRTQMHALAACRLQLGFKGRTYSGQPIKQFDAWISNKSSTSRSFWPGVLTLSDEYFNTLSEHAVPLDKRALLALKGSALAMDVYTWLAHRLYRVGDRGAVIHWAALREQFGQEYVGIDADKTFKATFSIALKKVLTVYPKAKVSQVKGGVLLASSPPPIPFKGP